MNSDDKIIDPVIAYKKTLQGIVITFIICNTLIFIAVAIGFAYTINKIDKTADNINHKIDKSYENTAEVSRKVLEKMQSIGTGIEKSVSNDVKEIKEKGKELLIDYLKNRADPEKK